MTTTNSPAGPTPLEARLEQLQSRLRRATNEFDRRLETALALLREHLDDPSEALARRTAELDQRERDLARQSEREQRAAPAAPERSASADDERLREADQARAAAYEQLEATREELEESRREVADLRMQNDDLARQLAAVHLNPGGADDQRAESLSWEERKQMMLAQLQQEDEGESGGGAEERLRMRDLVERTDRELQRRDAEIAELRQLLEQQSGAMGGVAVGAAAIAEMIDGNELIQEERAKLQRIQQEWEEKLRQAEIDVSLERARLSRERMELEERVAEMREQLSQSPAPPSADADPSAADAKASCNRRWLARLGLSDEP